MGKSVFGLLLLLVSGKFKGIIPLANKLEAGFGRLGEGSKMIISRPMQVGSDLIRLQIQSLQIPAN